jgi:hypothetical protein
LLVLDMVVHVPSEVVVSQRTTEPTAVPGVNVSVPLFEPLHTRLLLLPVTVPVPIAVVGSTVMFLESDRAVVHVVVVFVILVKATTTVGVVFKVGVLKVNVPEPVPVADEIATPSMVPSKLHP